MLLLCPELSLFRSTRHRWNRFICLAFCYLVAASDDLARLAFVSNGGSTREKQRTSGTSSSYEQAKLNSQGQYGSFPTLPFLEDDMISNYTEHSANERTFLAWLRTGIAVVAFGFVLEKFNLFILALASTAGEVSKTIRLDRVSGPFARYEGFALMAAGIVLILMGYLRFLRDGRMIDDPEVVKSPGVTTELFVTVLLALLVTAYCVALLTD